ncbi:MAG: cyclic pyranopterin monophosphate synthase MoaC [Thermodesulfobacteriota bacterium]
MSRDQAEGLTHLDDKGRAGMVDVGDKDVTSRRAVARGAVKLSEETLNLIMSGRIKKGDVFTLARVAGIMAAKKTSDLIPLCHPLNLSHVSVEIEPRPGQGRIEITAEVRCEGRTGVEMEALTAVAAAGLTIYDMAKAVDKGLAVTDIVLLSKSGGRSGTWIRPEPSLTES